MGRLALSSIHKADREIAVALQECCVILVQIRLGGGFVDGVGDEVFVLQTFAAVGVSLYGEVEVTGHEERAGESELNDFCGCDVVGDVGECGDEEGGGVGVCDSSEDAVFAVAADPEGGVDSTPITNDS